MIISLKKIEKEDVEICYKVIDMKKKKNNVKCSQFIVRQLSSVCSI